MSDKNYTSISNLVNTLAVTSSTNVHRQALSEFTTEIQELEEKITAAQLPSELSQKAHMQIDRIILALKHGGNVSQLDTIAKYIHWVTSMPWNKQTSDMLDIASAQRIMDKNHHGLIPIKRRIFEYLSVLTLQKKQNNVSAFHAPILFFVGLAGTGKTTLASSIAEALGRRFVRIPFGGLSSAIDLRGMSKAQPEAEPGFIMKSLARVGSKNPVVLLDELDRVVGPAHGEIMGVLLELLDPAQNEHFVDNYIDYPFDLSHVIFVATANNTQTISTAVMDRLEVIQMPSYSDDEKIVIAKDYILPRLLLASGVVKETLNIDEAVWKAIARISGYDPGIRSVERKVESIVRRVAYKTVSGQGTKFSVTEENMKDFIE